MSKILLIEDEPSMRIGLSDNLEFEGYEVDTAADGEEGYKKINAGAYDLIMLDVMLPKMSGFDILRTIRQKGNQTPVILLTAKSEEIDKVLGLELGADDYITKPFSLRELLARIKAVLRRSEASPAHYVNEDITIGKLTVNFNSYTAFHGKKSIQLSHKEFEVLQYIYKNRNNTVSRDDLLTNVWGYDEAPTTRTIDNFILKLRQKIEVDPNFPKIILTVHGIGYKIVGID